jgi:hypothetical protein
LGKKLQLMALPVAVAALTALTSGPAHAADGYDRCRANHYCMFSGLDGTGDMIEIQASTPDLAVLNMAGRSRSDWNRTGSTMHLFSETNYDGCSAVTTAGDRGNFLSKYQNFWYSVRMDGPNGPWCDTDSRSSAAARSHG